MNHIEYERNEKEKRKKKLLSHIFAAVNIFIGFFCLFEFAMAMRYVIGFSEEIYWLSKSWWQQVAIIILAMIFMGVILGGQSLYENEMLKKGRKIPISFIVITVCELVFLLVCYLITVYYF